MSEVFLPAKKTFNDYLKIMDTHIHSNVRVYPSLADGVEMTGGVGAWELGNYAEIVPINTITDDFDIHWINIEDADDNDIYEIVLFSATTEIGRSRIRTLTIANGIVLPALPFQTPIIPANTQIQAKIATKLGGSNKMTISILYHSY
jgi:hypothetical protein